MGKMTKALEAIAEKLVGVDVTELPAVDSGDNGAVLKVSGGKWGKGAETVELPAVTAENAGQVLMVNAQGQWVAASIPSQLPTVDKDTDAGKVLTVNSDGEWAAAALPE